MFYFKFYIEYFLLNKFELAMCYCAFFFFLRLDLTLWLGWP